MRFGSNQASIVANSKSTKVLSVIAPEGPQGKKVRVRLVTDVTRSSTRVDNSADFERDTNKPEFEYDKQASTP